MEDTIVAISTALGIGAISIIRLSGKESINIANKIFKGKDLTKVAEHTIHYGYIQDQEELIDEVLISVMLSPKTYTTEDIVEINTHGGISTTNKVLELCLNNGARLAEPGEFTKRAFLNGRIDLTKAEAVEDLIESQTEISRNTAFNQLTGSLSNLIKQTRQTIVSLMSNIEVNIDYPEYEDIETITIPLLQEKLIPIKEQLTKLIKESNNAKIIKDGINIALIGRPNVGKSSILNNFLDEEKAIVTNIAGTTRDIVEGSTILQGIKLNFIDTAGIRETTDQVESIGVEKSLSQIDKADLIILILNNNEELQEEDIKLYNLIQNKPHIIFTNKNDLSKKIDTTNIKEKIIFGNTTQQDGLKELKNKIIELFNIEKLQTKNQTYLTNARQISLIKSANTHINDALNAIENNIPIDLIENDIKLAFDDLGAVIGITYQEELIDEMFKNFCLGK